MVISDEKVEEVLSTITSLMKQMQEVSSQNGDLQRKNNELHEEMIQMLKSTAKHQQWLPADDENEESKPRLNRTNRPRPIRPIIEEGVDDFGWNLFLDKWQRYKQMTGVEDEHEVCLELRDSCSPEVNRMLFEFIGADKLNDSHLTEAILLKDIKAVAVRSIHKEVHRWHFNQIAQDNSEKVTKFVGRLKAQAILCDYNVECSCGRRVSYAEEMVAQRVVSGVTNPEHQSKVLGEAEDLNTLKKKVDKLISLETTDEASSKMRLPFASRSNPIKSSQYKRDQMQKLTGNDRKMVGEDNGRMKRGRSQFPGRGRFQRSNDQRSNDQRSNARSKRCRGCGRSSHPNGKTMARKDCPAWGQKCNACQKENHFEKVCERRSRASFAGRDTSGSEEDYFTETEDECLSDYTDDGEAYSFADCSKSEDFRLRHPPGHPK